MLDIGWSEFLVIGVVALVIVGPKELPVMFRTLGRFTAKARNMSREFSRAMEAAAKESGVGDVAKDLKSMTSPRSLGMDAMQNAAARFEKWDPLKRPTPVKPAGVKEAAVTGDDAAVLPNAPVVADIGPNTAALAAERAEKRAAVIQSAEKRGAERAAERAGAAATPAATTAKGAKVAKAGAEKPLVSAVAKAKAATKAAATAQPGAAAVEKPKPRPRSIAAAAETPAAPPAKPARKSPVQKAPAPKTPAAKTPAAKTPAPKTPATTGDA